MDRSPSDFEGKDTAEVLENLLEFVVGSGDDMEAKETRSGGKTDLNLYLCDNQGFEIGELDEWITHIAESNLVTGHAENWVGEHTVSEEKADENISLVTISTPAKNREDEFVFLSRDGYLWVLTTVHSDWRDKTIESLIDYLPCVERLYLSSEKLEELTRGVRDSTISGFTAKYHAPNRIRDATLQFTGAEEDDLAIAEKAFDAKPTRIEFDQTNSPSTAIQGSSRNDGRLSMRFVRRGSEAKATQTLLNLTKEYEEKDKASFKIEDSPEWEALDNGFAIEGYTSVELTDPDRDDSTEEEMIEELEEEVLNSNQYRHGIRDCGTKLRVFDTDHGETFDVAFEPPNIILYARSSTTALSLRDFVRDVFEDLDSTYDLSKSPSMKVS
jgi:hypothetical protein